jgi:hypothetical protein
MGRWGDEEMGGVFLTPNSELRTPNFFTWVGLVVPTSG